LTVLRASRCRALRIETVINDAYDIGALRRLEHFGDLAAKARDVNHRMLQTMRAGQDCVLASPAIERAAQPPSPRMADGPRPCGSAIPWSWPWPAPCR
jgi:hypothetical protein